MEDTPKWVGTSGLCVGANETERPTLGCGLELVCNEAVLSRGKGIWYPQQGHGQGW